MLLIEQSSAEGKGLEVGGPLRSWMYEEKGRTGFCRPALLD
jgi:hypothetical protein